MIVFALVGMVCADEASRVSATTSLNLDLRTGTRVSEGVENITYSPLWTGDETATAKITVNDSVLVDGMTDEGVVVWNEAHPGVYDFKHITTQGGIEKEVLTASFEIVGKDFAAGEIVATGSSSVYDGVARTISVTTPEGAMVSYASSKDGPFSETKLEFVDVGENIVWYKVEKLGYNAVVGSAKVTITARDIANVTIGAIDDQVYTGSAIKPTVTVTDGTPSIVKASDYDVSYKNNVNVGTATVTLTGKGNYTGTKMVNFTIKKKQIVPEGGDEPGAGEVPNGGASKYDVTVMYDGEGHTVNTNALEKFTLQGATVKFSYSLNGKDEWSGVAPVFTNVCEASVWYKISVDNYEDYIHEAKVTITARDIAKVSIGGIDDQIYTGSAITPTVTVTDIVDGNDILEASDYDVSYANNVNAGTATVTLTGKGNYKGTKTATFTITKKQVAKPAADATAFVYNETEQTYAVVENEYYTVSGNKRTDAGSQEVAVTLKDKENYEWADGATDDVTFDFIIAKADNEWTTKPTIADWTYGATASTPVAQAKVGDWSVTYDGGTPPTMPGTYSATFTVAESENYKALTETVSFTIHEAGIVFTASDTVVEYNGQGHGITLAVTKPENAAIKYSETGTDGTWIDALAYTDVCTDKVIHFMISADGYTTVTSSKTVTIKPRDIAKVTIADIADQVYTGSEIKPTMTVRDIVDGNDILKTSDYDVSYSDNINAGTATVTLTGKGNYTGTTTADFTITKKQVAKPEVDTTAFVYNETEQTYAVAESEYYTIRGNKRTDAGSQEVTVTLKDKENYEWADGTTEDVTFDFVITKADNEWTTKPSIADWTYGEAASTPVAQAKVGDWSVAYDGGTPPTMPGTYSATFTVAESDNYKALTETVSFTIHKAGIVFTASDTVVEYNGQGHSITLVVTKPENAVVKYSETGADGSWVDALAYTDICADKVIHFMISADGYKMVTSSKTVTIKPRDIAKVSIGAIDGQAYTGSAIEPVVTVADGTPSIIKASDYDVSYTDNINAGTATVTLTGKGNYTGTTTADFTIKKKQVTKPEADATAFVYNEVEQTYFVAEDEHYTVSGNKRTDAGSQEVTVTLKDKENYEWADGKTEDVTFDFVIAKADNEWTTNPTIADWTYGAAASEPKAAAKNGSWTIAYSSGAKPTMPGTYSATFTVVESENYKALTATVSFTIHEAGIQFTASDTEVEYDGKPHGITLAVTKPENVVVKYSETGTDGSWMDALTYTDVCADKVIHFMISADGYKTVTSSKKVTITARDIAKVSIADIADQVYTGSEIKPTITVTDGEPSIIKASDYDVSYANNINAGTATVTLMGKGNYTGTKTVTFTITKKQVAKPEADATAFVYNETEQTYFVAEDEHYAVSGNKRTNAGSYEVVVSLKDTENYEWADGTTDDVTFDFVIAKADNEWVMNPTIADWTYGATPSEPKGAAKNGSWTIAYSSGAKPTMPGRYSATFTVAESDNYKALTATVSFTIHEAGIVFTASDTEVEYDGKPHGITLAVTKPENVVIKYSETGADGSWVDALAYTDVCADEVIHFMISADGYTTVNGSKTVTITARDIAKVSVDAIAEQVYTGSEIKPTVTVTDIVDGNDILKASDYDVSYTDNINAGTATVTLTGKGNYTGTKTANFTITKKQVAKPKADATAFVYNETEQTYAIAENEHYTVSGNKRTNAGNYEVVVSLKDTSNYEWADGTTEDVTFNFTIAKADNEWTTKPSIADWTYGEAASEPNGAAKNGSWTIAYSSGAKPTMPGTYSATFTVAESDNYKALTATVPFTIYEAGIQFTASDTEVEYDGKPHGITLAVTKPEKVVVKYSETGTDGSWMDTLTYTDVCTDKFIHFTISADGYTTVTSSKKVTITARDIAKVSVDAIAEQVYTGSEIEPTVTVTDIVDGNDIIKKSDYDVSYENNVNAGIATVTLTGKGNYTGTKTATFTITKKQVTKPEADATAFVYNETEQTYAIAENEHYTVCGNKRTNAGNYEVIVSLKDSSNYEWADGTTEDVTFTFTIAKSENEWTTKPSIADWTYGATASTPVAQAKVGDWSVVYDGGTLPTMPGTYTATFTVAESENYKALTATVSFTIHSASIQFTASDTVVEYNGQAHSITLAVTKPENVVVKYSETGADGSWVDALAYTDVCTDKVIHFTISADGYTTVTSSKKVTITARDIAKVSIADIADQVYTGSEIKPTVTVTDGEPSIIKASDYDVSYSDNVNAGTATVTLTGKGNYAGTKTADFTITKKQVAKPEADTMAFVYNEAEQTYVIAESEHYTVGGNKRTDAGSQKVTVSLKDTANYEWADGTTEDVTFTFTIAKADNEWTTKPSIADWTYGEAASTPVAQAKVGDWSVAYDGGTPPTMPGTYSATFTVAESDNYKALTATVSFTIHEAGIQFTASDTEVEYDDKVHGITLVVTKPENVVIKYSETGADGSWVDALAYTDVCADEVIHFTISADGYKTVTSSKTVTITARDIAKVTIADIADQEYTGSEIKPTVTVTDIVDGNDILKASDYDVSYSDNVNAGTATVTLTGKGNYTGTKTATFTIKKKQIESDGGGEPGDGVVPTGGVSKYDITVMYDGEGHTINTNALEEFTIQGATVKFSYSLNGKDEWSGVAPVFTNVCEASVWYKISADNYADYIHEAKVTITNRLVTLTSGTKVDFVANGTAHSFPQMTVGGSGFVDGEGVVTSNWASVTTVAEGRVKNTFDYAARPGTLLSNYDITVVRGEIAVVEDETTNVPDAECPFKWEAIDAKCARILGLKNPGATMTKMVIPDRIEGLYVTEIAKGAFANTKCGVKELMLPVFCTTIGDKAFYNIPTLERITFVKTRDFNDPSKAGELAIGRYAFSGAISLTELELPETVASLGDYAFLNTRKLSSVTILGRPTVGKQVFRSSGLDAGGVTVHLDPALAAEADYMAELKADMFNVIVLTDAIVTGLKMAALEVAEKRVRLKVSVEKAASWGEVDTSSVRVKYRSSLTESARILEPVSAVRNPDGSIQLEVIPPEGGSGFFQTVIEK